MKQMVSWNNLPYSITYMKQTQNKLCIGMLYKIYKKLLCVQLTKYIWNISYWPLRHSPLVYDRIMNAGLNTIYKIFLYYSSLFKPSDIMPILLDFNIKVFITETSMAYTVLPAM